MAAKKGNKYAEKWTKERVLEMIRSVDKYNRQHKQNYHLGLALLENDLYPQWWSEMAHKFNEDKEVSEAIKKTEAFLEARIVNSTMSGEAKGQAMAIFYLKNKFGYVDKSNEEENKGTTINIVNGKELPDK